MAMRIVIRATGFLLFMLPFCSGLVATALDAATVGPWSKTCIAPNWITGAPEPVQEMNISQPGAPFWGFTSKQPGGHWLTQYNLFLLAQPAATPDVLIFLFYHECSHARFNTPDEHTADCQGLSAMAQDMGVTPSILGQITAAYASVGRPFPSGGPC